MCIVSQHCVNCAIPKYEYHNIVKKLRSVYIAVTSTAHCRDTQHWQSTQTHICLINVGMYFRPYNHRITTVSCAWLRIGKLKQPINKHISLLMSYAVKRYPRRCYREGHLIISTYIIIISHHTQAYDIINGLFKIDYDF